MDKTINGVSVADTADAGDDTGDDGGASIVNPWQGLRRHTAARIALGRSGISQPTAPQLAFQLAHAQARDAVHLALDDAALAASIERLPGLFAGRAATAGAAPDATTGVDGIGDGDGDRACLRLHSAAGNRQLYLQRPDLGRRLDDASRQLLARRHPGAPDLAFVIADGLSALAIERHALPFLAAITARLTADPQPWTLAPPAIVLQGRVAVGDEVASLLGARAVVVLIGERPGLSSPDSLGLYLTWAPRPGTSDAGRNCISNVRPQGLTYQQAAFKLHYLLSEARRRQLSGVALKDETGDEAVLGTPQTNFLLDQH